MSSGPYKDFWAWEEARKSRHAIKDDLVELKEIDDYVIDQTLWKGARLIGESESLDTTKSTKKRKASTELASEPSSKRRSSRIAAARKLKQQNSPKEPCDTPPASAEPTTEKMNHLSVERVLAQRGDGGFSCRICGEFEGSRTCGISCYNKFLDEHARLGSEAIEIRHTGSKAMGYGVFVKPGYEIGKGSWIGEYLGELLPIFCHMSDRTRKRNENLKAKNKLAKDGEPAKKNKKQEQSRYLFCLDDVAMVDAKTYGNWTRFMNHNCAPNVNALFDYVGGRCGIYFEAKRDILAGEQLTLSYGRTYFEQAGIQCMCDRVEGPHMPWRSW